MNMIQEWRRRAAAAVVICAVAAVVLGTAPVAARAATSAAVSPSVTQPTKYRMVNSGAILAPANAQSHGSVSCPIVGGVQTEPTGGGVSLVSSDLGANTNDSYPTGLGWAADVNNNSGTSFMFTVYAVCSKSKLTYTVVTTTVPNLPMSQSLGVATCPSGDKVLGGGVFSSSTALDVNVDDSIPFHSRAGYGWSAYMNNAGLSTASMTVYAVCSKYSRTSEGYTIVTGPGTSATPGFQSFADVSCPVVNGIQTVVLGGGELNGSTSTSFNMTDTYPASTTMWQSDVNNASGASENVYSLVVCAY